MVDDQRVTVIAAQVLGQVDLAAGGGNDQLTAGSGQNYVRTGAAACAGVGAALAVAAAHILGRAEGQRGADAVEERLHEPGVRPADAGGRCGEQLADLGGGVVLPDVERGALGLRGVILVVKPAVGHFQVQCGGVAAYLNVDGLGA